MPETQSVITREMQEAVGKESAPMIYEVERSGCRMFARAVGYTDLIFYDEGHARKKGFRNIVAPPGYLGTHVFRPGTEDPNSPDPIFDIPYARLLNGGNEMEYCDVVCAGDTLSATSKLIDIYERVG